MFSALPAALAILNTEPFPLVLSGVHSLLFLYIGLNYSKEKFQQNAATH